MLIVPANRRGFDKLNHPNPVIEPFDGLRTGLSKSPPRVSGHDGGGFDKLNHRADPISPSTSSGQVVEIKGLDALAPVQQKRLNA